MITQKLDHFMGLNHPLHFSETYTLNFHKDMPMLMKIWKELRLTRMKISVVNSFITWKEVSNRVDFQDSVGNFLLFSGQTWGWLKSLTLHTFYHPPLIIQNL